MLFTRKRIEDLQADASGETSGLKRTLGALNLTSLGIGAIIGAGIFSITGVAAAQYAGPALVISFIISAIACAFAGLCYAEFASMLPIAGSAYTYSYATIGELFAWIIGWDLIIEYLFASSTVAVAWSGYAVSFLEKNLHITIPDALRAAPLSFDPATGFSATSSIINLPAVLVIGIITVLLVRGIKESASFNNIIVFVKLVVILLFIIFGFQYVNPENWFANPNGAIPIIPENTGEFGVFGWSGIFRAAGVIFFAYIGFDAVSTAAQEAKNPKRDMPIGILASLAICTVLYILVTIVLTGIVPYTMLNVPDPIAVAVDATRLPDGTAALGWLSPFIKIGAIAGLSSVILVMLMGQPRIFFTMSRDGLLPSIFSKVHPKFKTPVFSTVLTGVVAMTIAGLFPINVLSELVSIGTLLAFVLVCAAVLILRRTHPNIERPFKTPLVPFVPIGGIVVCMAQMIPLPGATWERLVAWLCIGGLIYFFYGINHSKVNAGKTWAPLRIVRPAVAIVSAVFLAYVAWAHFIR
ncbi:MAG: amino acid permease [Bradyrhizobiaceae bacterium]|nr:amino acid permease [Bradyrhizobiaceae bacterium]